MKTISILNDVLGPVMRGPSSSHTAGPFHIAQLARSLLGQEPAAVTLVFDPQGSFAAVYQAQGSDLGFAAGCMGWSITDERFAQVLQLAEKQGLQIRFLVEPIAGANHPNTVELRMVDQSGGALTVEAQSIGGGAVVITRVAEWPIRLTGNAYEVLLVVAAASETIARNQLQEEDGLLGPLECIRMNGRVLLRAQRSSALPAVSQARLRNLHGFHELLMAPPLGLVVQGTALFTSASEAIHLAEQQGLSLGQIALAYEAALLGVSKRIVIENILQRFKVMSAAVHLGQSENLPRMRLLSPSARDIFQAESAGRLPIGGIHTRAAARALGVMHVNAGGGVVCAAPTAGSSGVIPGVIETLVAERDLQGDPLAMAILAAGAIGVIVAERATFAAEVAGCQVEIGASCAMAAAAVVEWAGGSALHACNAAAIAFQNSMGSICDPVQGLVEIPCHTRNAAAAANAFLCADLVQGGYQNPIPLDETIDAVRSVGAMLPCELRCTARGGLAIAPSAHGIASVKVKAGTLASHRAAKAEAV